MSDRLSSEDAIEDALPYLPRLRLCESKGRFAATPGQLPPLEVPTEGLQVGRNEMLDEIARGGMGAIVRGRDLELGRELAVKVMLDSRRDDPQARRRFVEEAQIGGQLQHPGVAPVYELGSLPDGRPFFTMKLVKGQTLASLLGDRGDLSQDRARFLGIFEQVCQTLAYAHSKGVIHRDLKPANVMVGEFGEVQVMDWGLAKALANEDAASDIATDANAQSDDEEPRRDAPIRTVRSGDADTSGDSAQTRDGAVMGTPVYMSPEQATGETRAVDERSDVFGLGAILCEILTGQPPHRGQDAADTLQRASNADLSEAFARLDACQSDAELVALCKRCLAIQRSDRPRSAAIVAEEMTAYFQSVENRLRWAEIAAAEASVKAVEERKRRRVTMALAATVLFLILLAGSVMAWQRDQQRKIAQEINDALSEASDLWGRAQFAPPDQADTLTQALETARRAESLLEARTVSPDLAQRVRRLVGEIRQGREDRRFVKALAEARIRSVDIDVQRNVYRHADVTEHYGAAFREFGIDPEIRSPDEATQLVRSRPPPIRDAIVSVLHDWASYEPRSTVRSWLRQVAKDADDDPWRGRLFSAGRSRKDLEELARDSDALQQPPSTLLSLSSALFSAGAQRSAINLLVAAQSKHPGDFWINQQLGSQLLRQKSPKPSESVPFLTAALSLRPGNAGILFNIGVARSALSEN